MSKSIFKSEEEAKDFFKDVFSDYNYDWMVKVTKEKGYIKLSKLEEAEKQFKLDPLDYDTIGNYILCLEREVKRLKEN